MPVWVDINLVYCDAKLACRKLDRGQYVPEVE
jgi:hypothetical protein